MANFKDGLLFGAFIGGLYGLLNAPQKGKDTRIAIKNYINQTTSDVKDVKTNVTELNESINILSTEGVQSLKEATEDIQISIKHFMEENQPRINRINNKVETLTQTIENSEITK